MSRILVLFMLCAIGHCLIAQGPYHKNDYRLEYDQLPYLNADGERITTTHNSRFVFVLHVGRVMAESLKPPHISRRLYTHELTASDNPSYYSYQPGVRWTVVQRSMNLPAAKFDSFPNLDTTIMDLGCSYGEMVSEDGTLHRIWFTTDFGHTGSIVDPRYPGLPLRVEHIHPDGERSGFKITAWKKTRAHKGLFDPKKFNSNKWESNIDYNFGPHRTVTQVLNFHIGKKMAPFVRKTLKDEKLDLFKDNQEIYIWFFWSIESKEVEEIIPVLNDLSRKYRKGVSFISISRDRRKHLEEYVRKNRFLFKHVINGEGLHKRYFVRDDVLCVVLNHLGEIERVLTEKARIEDYKELDTELSRLVAEHTAYKEYWLEN